MTMLSLFSHFIFGQSGLFSGGHFTGGLRGSSPSWRDKNLCFDLRTSELELDHGEQLIACFFPIEDVKGNPDELGVMKVTNLRLIWICCDKKRVNLSIGWRTVSLAFEQNLKNSFGSTVTSLSVLSKFESTKYEFVFNKMPAYDYIWNGQVDTASALDELRRFLKSDKTLTTGFLTPMYLVDPFEVVFSVWQAYKRTHLFRHCRSNLTDLFSSAYLNQAQTLQRSPVRAEEINRLPGEEILDVYAGIVQSETRLVRYTGTLVLTNVRLIWADEALLLRNLSIPYTRVESIKTKQADKLIVNTQDYLATSNQIEFRAQRSADSKRTRVIFEQVQNFHSLYRSKPKYGPESCEECLEIMNHLRPTENYIDSSLAGSRKLGSKPEGNFGPMKVSDKQPIGSYNEPSSSSGTSIEDYSQMATAATKDGQPDGAGEELTEYCTRLNHYLGERPIEHDQEVIYSKELGLAIERPMNDVELERIWKIDLT